MIDLQNVLKEVMGHVASGEPIEEVLSKAEEAKLKLSQAWGEVSQALQMLDTMVATFAPGTDWPIGWVAPDWRMATTGTSKVAGKPRRPKPTKKQQIILDIAARLVTEGHRTVMTKAIADILKTQGDQRPIKDIGTAVGNVLAKSGIWTKVKAGEYSPSR